MNLKTNTLILLALSFAGQFAFAADETYCVIEFFEQGTVALKKPVALAVEGYSDTSAGGYATAWDCYKVSMSFAKIMEITYGESRSADASSLLYEPAISESVFYFINWRVYSTRDKGDSVAFDKLLKQGQVTSHSPEQFTEGDQRILSSGKKIQDALDEQRLQIQQAESQYKCHIAHQIEDKNHVSGAGDLGEKYLITASAAECRQKALAFASTIKAFPTYGVNNVSPGTNEYVQWNYEDAANRSESKQGLVNEFTTKFSPATDGDERYDKRANRVVDLKNY